ncbi:MAG: hypothetical protein RSE18_01780 [Acinetobacter sp.]
MDIQRIKELALANGFSLKPQASGNMDLNAYVYDFANAIEQAATAQAVPNAQQALHDRLLVKSIREHVERHISEISVNDLFDKGWLAAMKCIQNNIDMLEAQEPTND